jgi:hypothetical protein
LLEREPRSTKLPVDYASDIAVFIDQEVPPVAKQVLVIKGRRSIYRLKTTKARYNESLSVRIDRAAVNVSDSSGNHVCPPLKSEGSARLIKLSPESFYRHRVYHAKHLA